MDDFRLALELAKAASERSASERSMAERAASEREAGGPRPSDISLLGEIRELLAELVRLHRPTVWIGSAPVGTATFPATGLILS